jgi:hypothetical protein
VGYVSPAAADSAVPIILAATGPGLLVSAVWAAALGQSLVACPFGPFAASGGATPCSCSASTTLVRDPAADVALRRRALPDLAGDRHER